MASTPFPTSSTHAPPSPRGQPRQMHALKRRTVLVRKSACGHKEGSPYRASKLQIHEIPWSFINLPTLCDTCIQIDLRRLLRNEDAHYQPIPLGNLAHITHKADPATANPEDGCSLCKLVIAAVDRAAFFLPEPITDRANVDAALYPLGSRLCVRLSHSPFGVFQGMGGAQIPCVPELRLVADDMHEWPASEMDGRPVRDLLDLELVKYWIHLCENEHGPECSVPWWAPAEELPVTVRLLDVQEMVLVPATRGRRYIALSYVWGDPKACAHDAYWTTSANLSSRTTKTRHKSKRKECKGEWEWSGGVPLDVLPPTITDTILLTRLLGERYLWVDALCILQDSPSDKAEQSSIMDAVLRRAFLTIIAAGGPDATAPLPGLRTGTRARASARQRSEEIHDLRLAVPLRTPYEALTGTPWNACARTYQELMLSPRRLLFTPEQVVFECGECVWAEDLVPEPRDTAAGPGAAELMETRVVDRLMFARPEPPPVSPGQAHGAGGEVPEESWLDDYLRTVEGYTARRLAHEADAVSAFTGITNAFAKAFGLGGGGDPHRAFRYGVSVTELETALLWQPEPDVAPQRRVVGNCPGHAHLAAVSFPSWAFVGWRNAVRYAGDGQFVGIREGRGAPDRVTGKPTPARPVVGDSLVDEWHIVDENGELVRLDVRPAKQERAIAPSAIVRAQERARARERNGDAAQAEGDADASAGDGYTASAEEDDDDDADSAIASPSPSHPSFRASDISASAHPSRSAHYVIPSWDWDWHIPPSVAPGVEPGTLVFRTTVACLPVRRAGKGAALAGKHHSLFSILAASSSVSSYPTSSYPSASYPTSSHPSSSSSTSPSTPGGSVAGRIILRRPGMTLQSTPTSLEFAVLARARGVRDARWMRAVGADERFRGYLLYVMALAPASAGSVRSGSGVRERLGVGVVLEKAWYEAGAGEEVVLVR